MTIHKTEIFKEVVRRQEGLTQNAGEHAVDTVFEVIAAALSRGDDVRISGFGTFSCREYPARDGVHPRTGEPIQIAASVRVSFRPHDALKEQLNPRRLVGPDRGRAEALRRKA